VEACEYGLENVLVQPRKERRSDSTRGGSARLRSQGRLGTLLRSLKKESDNLLAGGETAKCCPGKKKLADRWRTWGELERSVPGGQKKAGGQGATLEDMVDLLRRMAGGKQNNKTSKRRQSQNSPVFGDS
jgi:hypothetical protein